MRTTRTWPLTLREEAGVPVVPPAWVVRGTARVRGLLATLNDHLGLPMQVLLEHLTGVLDAPALCALVELDLPDRLLRPSTAAELAAVCGCDADALTGCSSYLASRGCVRRDRHGRYSANRVTRLADPQRRVERLGPLSGFVVDHEGVRHLLGAVRAGTDPIVGGSRRRLLHLSPRPPRSGGRVPRCDGRRGSDSKRS